MILNPYIEEEDHMKNLIKYNLAFKDYNKVLELDKNNSNAALSIAIHHIRNSNYELAELYSNKVIKTNSDLHQGYFILGRITTISRKILRCN